VFQNRNRLKCFTFLHCKYRINYSKNQLAKRFSNKQKPYQRNISRRICNKKKLFLKKLGPYQTNLEDSSGDGMEGVRETRIISMPVTPAMWKAPLPNWWSAEWISNWLLCPFQIKLLEAWVRPLIFGIKLPSLHPNRLRQVAHIELWLSTSVLKASPRCPGVPSSPWKTVAPCRLGVQAYPALAWTPSRL